MGVTPLPSRFRTPYSFWPIAYLSLENIISIRGYDALDLLEGQRDADPGLPHPRTKAPRTMHSLTTIGLVSPICYICVATSYKKHNNTGSIQSSSRPKFAFGYLKTSSLQYVSALTNQLRGHERAVAKSVIIIRTDHCLRLFTHKSMKFSVTSPPNECHWTKLYSSHSK